MDITFLIGEPGVWHGPSTKQPISEFLTMYRPSENCKIPSQRRQGKVIDWYWVFADRATEGPLASPTKRDVDVDKEKVKEEGKVLWDKLVKEVRELKETGAVARKEKEREKKGLKKEMAETSQKEELFRDFRKALEKLGKKYRFQGGKWLVNCSAESVDETWTKISRGLANHPNGPFPSTPTRYARVPCAPNHQFTHDEETYMIQIGCDESYDYQEVKKSLEALLKMGIKPSSYKSDVYSMLQIYWPNEVKLSPTIWHPDEFFTSAEIELLLAQDITLAQSVRKRKVSAEEEEADQFGPHFESVESYEGVFGRIENDGKDGKKRWKGG